MSSRRHFPGIRVCTGLTRAIHGLGALHSTERFSCDTTINSIHQNFFEIPLDEQNPKLTLRNMAG
ncbi:hypothetical protein CN645_04265 [Burkholderia sp. IDO3]|nr:hypothetical protein DCN14_03190 [Burkholderia sp. IDO3]PCD62988.1 hypothetical protein CN645_04265 [Burkholderia sp. IDO3]